MTAPTRPAAAVMRPLRPAEQQWVFDPAMLERTPSRADGISLEEELERRKEAIVFMRSLWLRVAQYIKPPREDPESYLFKGPLTAAATLVHRFFMRRSVKDFEPKLIAPTILFLASKVEEDPMRLRHIINACLQKFEPGSPIWEPQGDNDIQPLEHRRWEKELLAIEEVALEALCFDMIVEQPWPILWQAVKGLNTVWDEPESSAAAEARAAANGSSTQGDDASANGDPKGKSRATEAVVCELGWAMLNEGYLSPLPVLHPAPIIAFAVFALVLAMVDEVPVSTATATAAELGDKFGLDIQFDEAEGAKGTDVAAVKDAVRQYIEYCDAGIIDKGLLQYIVSEPTGGKPQVYHRRLKLTSAVNGGASGTSPTANGRKK